MGRYSILALVLGSGSAFVLNAQTQVNLSPAASPSSGQPGITAVNITGSNFPAGTISPSSVTVSLQPAAGGAKTTTPASTITTITGSTRRVTFTIPTSISVKADTAYNVSVAGITSTGTAFASSNTASLTIEPGASITLLNPNTAQQGQTLAVTITGQFTNFVQGATQANFGAGISVGGAAAGALGSVTVSSATSAVATITIASNAAPGTRSVTVQTGTQQETVTGGFTVAPGTPVITQISPNFGQQGQVLSGVPITGAYTHFAQGTSVVSFSNASVTATQVQVTDATHLTATLTLSPTATTGVADVTVVSGTETATGKGLFTIVASGPANITNLDFAVYATGTGCGAIQMAANVLVDSFDSSQGSYAQTQQASKGIVGTSGNIQLAGNVTIDGPIVALNTSVGACKNGTPGITLSGNAKATGGYIQLTAAPVFQPLPVLPHGTQDRILTSNTTLPPGSYGNISVIGHSTLTLTPGTYNINSIVFVGQSVLAISPTGQVILNVAGKNVPLAIDFTGGVISNAPGRPVNLQFIYGGTGPIILFGGASANAILYAPNADVTLAGGSDWFGGMVVKTLNNLGNVALHYDRSLAMLPTISGAVSPPANGAGWDKTNVTVTFTCADPILGIAICTPPVAVTTDGANRVVSGTAVNRAGFSASASATVNLDKTPPTISVTAAPTPNANGWNNTNVTENFSCADALSGVATCPTPVVVSTNGANQTTSGTATDKAGNTASASLTVNIDKTPPTITAAVAPAPNAAGWNNANPTVTFTCADALSGISSCASPVNVTTETTGQAVSGTATDKAGNSAIASTTIKLDKTPPTISAAVAPPPNAAGWNNSNPTVTFTCADAVSGIGSCTAPVTVTTETTGQAVNGTATDKAGNTATASATVNLDKTPPTITAAIAPGPNAGGWNNSNPTVTFTCTDALSGISACTPPVAVATETTGQAVGGTATDKAGNTVTASATVKLDKTPPTLTISSPVNGANVATAALIISGTVNDALSGVANVTCSGAPGTVTAGAFTCAVTLEAGSNTINVSATDAAGNSASSALSVTFASAPTITITVPTNLSYLNLSPTTVNGTVSDPTAKVVINSIQAPVSNGAFSMQLPLAEGPNLITATATSSSGAVGTATIQVTLDTTPPHVTITSPPDQFVTTATSVSVAGSVNDIVVGTVNAQQAQVSVNGVAAQVSNRTFLATNIPLNVGTNVIQAVARDQAGNPATTQITVTRQAPTQQPQIQSISGDNQTAVLGSVLPAPVVVALTDSSGKPVANTPVIFNVTQNNGMVGASAAPAASLVVNTNAQGQAMAQWTLGMRAGAGGNTLQAYAVGFNGTAIFTATGTLGPAGKIVIDTGNDQIGAIGQSLPKPLIAVVVDSGNNRLPNVPVTFTVQQGGGSLVAPGGTNFTLQQGGTGQTSITVNSDSDGRVGATLILGLQEGNSNNLVEANFPNNQGFPVSFTASGRAAGDPASTTITGVVLDNSNVPIPGVTIRAVLTNQLNSNSSVINAAATVQTNAQGQFSIPQAPVGFVKLLVDGSTAQLSGTYPTLDYDMVTIAGQNNTLQMPIYLLPLKASNQLCVTDTTGGGTLTIPEAPGFSLTFGPGQVTFPGGSKTGCISITVVHPDRVPMTPGFGQQPRFIVTIQPSGALFNPPAPITLPNVDGLKPRAVTEMYSFDHDISSFVAIGTGTVSDDGMVIRSNPGVGVLKAGWHCGGDPTARGTVADCPACQFCEGASANSVSCIPYPGSVGELCSPTGNQCIVGVCGGTRGTGSIPNMPTGICENQIARNCDDGNVCNGVETCDPAKGCVPGTPPQGGSCGPCWNGGSCDGTGNCAGGTPLTGAPCGNGGTCDHGTCKQNMCGTCPDCRVCSGNQCVYDPSTDGKPCGNGGTCDNGNCSPPMLEIYEVDVCPQSCSTNAPSGLTTFVGPRDEIVVKARVNGTSQQNAAAQISWTTNQPNPPNGAAMLITTTGPEFHFIPSSTMLANGSVDTTGAPWNQSNCDRTNNCAGNPLPHPALQYMPTATLNIGGMTLTATPNSDIKQDEADILTQEYPDFNTFLGCAVCFVPARAQIGAATNQAFNTGNYSLIVNSSNLQQLIDLVQQQFNNLYFTDIQAVVVGATCPTMQPDCVVVKSGPDLQTAGQCPPSSGNGDIRFCPDGADISAQVTAGFFTDPQGDDVCQHRDASNNCLGPITAGPNGRADTIANNRPLVVLNLGTIISSAYRNPQRNFDAGSTTEDSRHVRGQALDIDPRGVRVPGLSTEQLMCMIERAGDLSLGPDHSFTENNAATFLTCSDSAANHVHVEH